MLNIEYPMLTIASYRLLTLVVTLFEVFGALFSSLWALIIIIWGVFLDLLEFSSFFKALSSLCAL